MMSTLILKEAFPVSCYPLHPPPFLPWENSVFLIISSKMHTQAASILSFTTRVGELFSWSNSRYSLFINEISYISIHTPQLWPSSWIILFLRTNIQLWNVIMNILMLDFIFRRNGVSCGWDSQRKESYILHKSSNLHTCYHIHPKYI